MASQPIQIVVSTTVAKAILAHAQRHGIDMSRACVDLIQLGLSKKLVGSETEEVFSVALEAMKEELRDVTNQAVIAALAHRANKYRGQMKQRTAASRTLNEAEQIARQEDADAFRR